MRRGRRRAAARCRRRLDDGLVEVLGLETRPEPGQVETDLLQSLVSVLGTLGECTPHDRFEIRADPRVDDGQPLGLIVHDAVHRFVEGVGPERLPVHHQLVHHSAEREDVAPAIERAAAKLLRGHVARCANRRAGARQRGVHAAGDAEVEHLHGAGLAAEHQIRRLHVAVDHAAVVRVAERAAGVAGDLQFLEERHRRATPDDLRQRLARHVLHGDEGLVVVRSDVEDRDDVGVLQAGCKLGFADEALAEFGVVGAENLEGDQPADGRIERQVQGPHPALTKRFAHLIAADQAGNGHTSDGRDYSEGTGCPVGVIAAARRPSPRQRAGGAARCRSAPSSRNCGSAGAGSWGATPGPEPPR